MSDAAIRFQEIHGGDAIKEANVAIGDAVYNCLDAGKPLKPKRTVRIEVGLVPLPGQGRQHPFVYAHVDFHPVKARRPMQAVQVQLVQKRAYLETSQQATMFDDAPLPMVINGEIPTVETLLEGKFLRELNYQIQLALEDLIDPDRAIKGTRKVKASIEFVSNDAGDLRENYEVRHQAHFTPTKRILPVRTYTAKTTRPAQEADFPVAYDETVKKEQANA